MSTRARSIASTSGASTSTVDSIPRPTHYKGVYSDLVVNIINSSNKILIEGKASDTSKLRKACARLLEQVESWRNLSPVNSLIQVASIRDKVQDAVTQIDKVAKRRSRPVPVDFEGIRREVKKLLDDESLLTEAKSLSHSRAELLLGSLQVFLDGRPVDRDREEFLKLLKDLSDATNALPCNIILSGVVTQQEEGPFREQGYASTYKGTYRGVDISVTVVHELDNTPRVDQRWRRQVIAWRQLDHDNIAKVIGVGEDIPYSLVADYQSEGSIRDYLKKAAEEDRMVDYARLIDGITAGIEYLHTRNTPMSHGDLRGDNIVMTSKGVPLIVDVGLARFQHNVQRSSSFHRGGSAVRWMAPEISEDPESSNVFVRSSTESDMYSLGMTMFEIITGQDPFSDMDDIPAIRAHVQQKNGRPAFPEDLTSSEETPSSNPLARYIPLIEECWKQRPEDRISITELRAKLASIDVIPSVPPSPSITKTPSLKAESILNAGGGGTPTSSRPTSVLEPISEVGDAPASVPASPQAESSADLFSANDDRSEMSVSRALSATKKMFPGVTRRLPFGKLLRRRKTTASEVDASSERRVVVSLDVNSQELVVGGAHSDVEQVTGELEYVLGIVQGNYFGDQLMMSKRARKRLALEDARETMRLASLNTGDLSVRIDPTKGRIFFLGPREDVLNARDAAQDVLDEIDREATVYFNADPDELPKLREAFRHVVKRCRIESGKLHHEVFVNFPSDDSPSSTVRIDGQAQLVDAILSAYETGEWKGDLMATLDCPISARTLYALMRSRVHQMQPLEEIAYPDVGVKYLAPEDPMGQHIIRFTGTRRDCTVVVDALKERVALMRREVFVLSTPADELKELGLRKELEGVRVVVEDLKAEEREGYTSDPQASVWCLTAVNKIDMKLAGTMLQRPGANAQRWRSSRGSAAFSVATASSGGSGTAVSPIVDVEASP